MTSRPVLGIDVGGNRKGFHAVAIQDGQYLDQLATPNLDRIVAWCCDINPSHIAIDSPCRWSSEGKSRLAERLIYAEGIHSFYTPTSENAGDRPFYHWVKNGLDLFRRLKSQWPIYDGSPATSPPNPSLIETYPHAITCSFFGRIAKACDKRQDRRYLVEKAGITLPGRSNIDTLDAVLCALAAEYFSHGRYKAFGDASSGWIVLPLGDFSYQMDCSTGRLRS